MCGVSSSYVDFVCGGYGSGVLYRECDGDSIEGEVFVFVFVFVERLCLGKQMVVCRI